MSVKGKDLVKKFKQNGWYVDRVHGSHYVMKKGSQTETIPVHNKDLPVGLRNAIQKRTGI